MSAHERPLIGSVVERTSSHTPSTPSSRFTKASNTGFPTAQHRSRSVFARANANANTNGISGSPRRIDVPPSISKQLRAQPSIPTSPIVESKPIPTDADALRRQIHEENARMIARMSDAEIEQERRAVLEQLGEGTERLVRRVQEARLRKEAGEREARVRAEMEEQAMKEVQGEIGFAISEDGSRRAPANGSNRDGAALIASPLPRLASHELAFKPGVHRVKSLESIRRLGSSPLPTASSTRPSSRTGRKLRFAEVTPDDVHVYESAPVSPKRPVLALPPPPDTKDDAIVSLGMFRDDTIPSKRPRPTDSPTKAQFTQGTNEDGEPEEGTPEYIRRRFFPSVPSNDPSVAWMEAPLQEPMDPSAPRFDLHGAPIPTSLSASLPSHLGLHHHAEGSHAGYTIDDIFLLARSTVPAQRASMLGILAKIAHRLGLQVRGSGSPGNIVAFAGKEGELRKRIIAAGLTAIDQIGSLGARAVEVVWECLVEWDRLTSELEGVELALAPDIVSLLQPNYFVPQVTDVLSRAALPPESLAQLLQVVHWLAQQSNQVADVITNTPRLIPTILDTFLLTPIPPEEDSTPPNPAALQLLITLASASRSGALALLDPADALLRFVTLLPLSSPYPPALATTLLTYTLRFYATLASYGLYSHIATTASQAFTALTSYITTLVEGTDVQDAESRQLCVAWVSLLESWIVCATDPHATTPPHDILWSQICAWGWVSDVRKLRGGLGHERSDWAVYAAIWDAEAAWLEGARINGIKGGEEERQGALQILKSAFAAKDGPEFRIVQHALEAVQRDLAADVPDATSDGERALKSLASAGNVLASALRLWLACTPLVDDSLPLSTPPFALPLSDLSALSATLVKHPIWALPSTLGAAHLEVHLRPLTRFIIHFHRVSRYIPGTTPQLWFTQALVFLSRLRPGDESHALAMLDAFLLVTPQFVGVDPARLTQSVNVDVLRPFFEYTIRPEGVVYVAPLQPDTESVSRSSTLRLPSLPSPPSPGPPSGEGNDIKGQPARTFASGLPFTRDFLFTPLTHLLRSGTSPVFHALLGDWMASEVDVVRATLLLAYAARRVLVVHGLEEFVHGAAEVVFACMRVCMLEHGVGAGGGEVEVFRDAGVEQLMAWLLEPFTVRGRSEGQDRDGLRAVIKAHTCTLEDASASYLGSTPFYQFYTDLVGLYGAVSFGHGLFAALVVTPLSMHYAVDYRRALWCGGDSVVPSPGSGTGQTADGGAGLGDVVRSVRIPIEDVVCTSDGGDPREYLYPIERDVGVLGAYVAALVACDGGGVEGFLRFVAVHHVACTVWGLDELVGVGEPEEEEEETRRREEMRARLLRGVLVRGELGVVRDVVLYRQRARGTLVWPPTCYRGGEEEGGWRRERVAFVRRVMGDGQAERVGALLMPNTSQVDRDEGMLLR